MSDLLPDPPTAPQAGDSEAAPYQVLARKYRPQNFDDLIGHGAMVRTLENAFASGRIAHAYVLTGVRGVGKTTTARILARALNYVGPDGEDDGPQIKMPAEGRHCRAIAESRHPDVLEMDAASRTGVGDIRELIEGVRYAPVEARYKVYIIDEVHMLSTAAFNALLKTLEEPPPHVKFIFATTEIRKLPVTVLSRCQRFDLRRIDADVLTDHLAAIAEKEGAKIDRDGLWMIARAAEGSVRDGLSILDQALVQHSAANENAGAVSADTIRDMLGLADRSQIWDLLNAVFSGDAKAGLEMFRGQYDAGADPAVIIRDMLEVIHLLTRVKAAGPEAASHGAAGEADAEQARNMADGLQLNALTRGWSLLMRGLTETQNAPDPAAAAEMALIRLAYAADLPTPDEALRLLKGEGASAPSSPPARKSGGGSAAGARGQTPPRQARSGVHAVAANPSLQEEAAPHRPPQPSSSANTRHGPRLETLKDIARLAGEKRDVKLRIEIESYVHLISMEQGRLDIRLHERAPADLAGRMTQALKSWTGDQWIVSVDNNKQGADTLRDARYAEVMAHPLVQETLEIFPGAEIRAIRDMADLKPDAGNAAGDDVEEGAGTEIDIDENDDDENGDGPVETE